MSAQPARPEKGDDSNLALNDRHTMGEMDLEAKDLGGQMSSPEVGMNIISADFDLIMVNRPNERLYGKPMVDLLGKKCYREFEKRDEPCPHCPGRLSLLTGGTHEAEADGRRDDGTWFSARIRTHPVQGLGDIPTGFIEVVEDITEEKRAATLARIEADLRADLTSAQNVRKALTLAFGAVLRVDGIDGGCVVLLRGTRSKYSLVVQRNLTEDCLRALLDRTTDQAKREAISLEMAVAGVTGAPKALAEITIVHRGRPMAVMIVTSSTYPVIPSTLLSGLESLGATVADTVSRIWAEQSRGDAVADLETIITHAPVATFTLDVAGCVTMWNRAAEQLFGWRSAEVFRRPCPFSEQARGLFGAAPDPAVYETDLENKDGLRIPLRLTVSAFRDVVGVASTVIVMAEDLSLRRRLEEMEIRLAALEEGHPAVTDAVAPTGACATESETGSCRALLVYSSGTWPHELAAVLCDLGHEAVLCDSLGAAEACMSAAAAEGRPLTLAVVDLVAADGSGGLASKAALREVGFRAPIVVSSDADVRGHEEHGFAGAFKRPYRVDDVREALEAALKKAGEQPR